MTHIYKVRTRRLRRGCSLRPSPIGTLRGEGIRVAPEGTSPQGLLTQKRWGEGGGGERGEDRLVA
eukprot:scaffold10301_cov121-Isochrysis_galbana.AAC.4